MSISLRKATDADFPTIQAIAHATWPVTFGDILSPDQIAYMLNWMYSIDSIQKQVNEQGHVFLIASVDEREAGYASYELNYEGEPQVKLHKIYILPQMQGKGVGKILLDEVSRIAREAYQQQLLLNVNRENKAVQFYEKYGFHKLKEVDISIGNGFLMQDYIMALPLNN